MTGARLDRRLPIPARARVSPAGCHAGEPAASAESGQRKWLAISVTHDKRPSRSYPRPHASRAGLGGARGGETLTRADTGGCGVWTLRAVKRRGRFLWPFRQFREVFTYVLILFRAMFQLKSYKVDIRYEPFRELWCGLVSPVFA